MRPVTGLGCGSPWGDGPRWRQGDRQARGQVARRAYEDRPTSNDPARSRRPDQPRRSPCPPPPTSPLPTPCPSAAGRSPPPSPPTACGSSRGSTPWPTHTACIPAPVTSSCTGSGSSDPVRPGSSAVCPTASRCIRPDSISNWSRSPGRWAWVSGWARTHRSAEPSSACAPSSWPGPTAPRPWRSAPASLHFRCATSVASPTPCRPATVVGPPNNGCPESEQMRRRAQRLAGGLAASGAGRAEIERRLAHWQFHPAVAYGAAERAVGPGPVQPGPVQPGPVQPGSSSRPAGVRPQ